MTTKQATFRDVMITFHRTRGRTFPWRDSKDLFEVLVGEVLLQRTRGEHVVPVYHEVLRRWPNPVKLGRAHLKTIERVVKPLGLAKRASVLKDMGRALATLPVIPTDPEDLIRLPGIGPYGAHAVPVFALGRDLPVVDWVIARVLRRYFGLPAEQRPNADAKLWELARRLASRGQAKAIWLGTLDYAAAVCKPRPLCGVCALRWQCSYVSRASGG